MLDNLQERLQEKDYQIYLRGEGKSRFLFIKGNLTSVEVSEDGTDLWIEFWTTSDETLDDSPAMEKTYKTVEEALEAISSWVR